MIASRINILSKHIAAFSNQGKETIFDLILSKKISSTMVYEDDKVYAFKDVSPQAPVHILIIPKHKDGLTGISMAQQRHTQILGHMLVKAKQIAHSQKLDQGYRLVINDGKNGQQTVDHLHLHLLGGRQMKWPPG